MKRFLVFLLTINMMYSLIGCASESAEKSIAVSSPQVEDSITADKTKKNTETKEPADSAEPTQVPQSQADTVKSGNIVAHFLDVGQGDSSFIELPNGETMLIDAGNSHNAEDIIGYIKSQNHNELDYVVATHPHADHIGGMADVIDSFEVGKMYMPKKEHTSNTFENMLNSIETNGVDLYTAKAGVSVLDTDVLDIDVLAPVSESYSNLNNYSAVVKITYGNTVFLFTGDAEQEVESSILNSKIDADVLKVGHHGSDTSSSESFIKAVSPAYAVISVGEGNQYGHPDSVTLARLNNYGAKIYRTDEVGTIVISADSNDNITVDKNESAIKENAPPVVNAQVQTQEEAPEEEENQGTVVYRTRTGEKYHRSGCSYLKSKIETTVSEAQAMGLTPCSRCNPPR